jgi:hypothetical protein
MQLFRTEDDLERLVKNRASESLHLDFKRSDALAKNDRARTELAKDAAAMATSEGGVLLYGVVEDRQTHEAIRLDQGVDPAEFPKEWIEQVVHSKVSPTIEGLQVEPIELKATSPGRYAYAVTVPASDRAPHMVDHRYYMRLNFSSMPMEDYHVRDVMARRKAPRLEIEFHVQDGPAVVVRFEAHNVGSVSAEDLYLEVEFDYHAICEKNWHPSNHAPVVYVRFPEPKRGQKTHILTYQQTDAPPGRGTTGYRQLPRLLYPGVRVLFQELLLPIRKDALPDQVVRVTLYARDMLPVRRALTVLDLLGMAV